MLDVRLEEIYQGRCKFRKIRNNVQCRCKIRRNALKNRSEILRDELNSWFSLSL